MYPLLHSPLPGSISNKLMGVNVPVIDNADCETYVLYRGQIKPGMVCMGFLEDGGYDSCQVILILCFFEGFNVHCE